MSRNSSVPANRWSRLGHMGRLAGGLAGGALKEGVKHWSRGQTPALQDLLLTPANAQRMAEKLSRMRGAAMKLGQLLSMDSGEILSPEWSLVLARLRDQAHHMPLGQLNRVLVAEWGQDWQQAFAQFNFTPVAAASIGQVHRARLKDGRELALKVQYPGVSDSIDSDLRNVAMLLKSFRLLPQHLSIDGLLQEAQQQLHEEADYELEAQHLQEFSRLLGDDDDFIVPDCHSDWTTSKVLAMDWLDGEAIETLQTCSSELRNEVATRLLRLSLKELLQWGVVQTDPNFANYRFSPASAQIQLLDFGAVRHYEPKFRETLRQLFAAALADAADAILEHAQGLGYLQGNEPDNYQQELLQLFRLVITPARQTGLYDFGQSDLAQSMRQQIIRLRLQQEHGVIPPAQVLFLHRKLVGLYLLFARLRVQIDVAEEVRKALKQG